MSQRLGQPIVRKEDPALLSGRGRYADDLPVPPGAEISTTEAIMGITPSIAKPMAIGRISPKTVITNFPLVGDAPCGALLRPCF